MLVFVDESGDPGANVAAGASPLFVVTAVLFEDRHEADCCDRRINGIRSELGFHESTEFRFNKCSSAVRRYFLQHVSAYEFSHVSIVLDKVKLSDLGLQPRDSFYRYAVNLVFQVSRPHLRNAIIVIDRGGGLEFRQQLARFLKRRINDRDLPALVKRVRMEPSHNNNLLQLADMICGAVARSFRQDKADRSTYRDCIRHRELIVHVCP